MLDFHIIVDYNVYMQPSAKVNPGKAVLRVTILVAIEKHTLTHHRYNLDIQCIFYDDARGVKLIFFCVKKYQPLCEYFKIHGIFLPILYTSPAQRHPVILYPPNANNTKKGAFAALHCFTNQACHKDSPKAAGTIHTLPLFWSGLPLGGFYSSKVQYIGRLPMKVCLPSFKPFTLYSRKGTDFCFFRASSFFLKDTQNAKSQTKWVYHSCTFAVFYLSLKGIKPCFNKACNLK